LPFLPNKGLYVYICWYENLGDLPYSCGSPRNPAPTGGLRLPAGKHTSILTVFQTEVKKKGSKRNFFLVIHAKLATVCS